MRSDVVFFGRTRVELKVQREKRFLHRQKKTFVKKEKKKWRNWKPHKSSRSMP
jgi:hypothetical protein